MEIRIAKEWMKRKLTIEDAEAELLGLCNSVKWKTLIARMSIDV